MLIGRFAQTGGNQAYLTGREAARAGAVTHCPQFVVQTGVMVNPTLELLPSGLRGDVWTIGLCKLRSSIFTYLELHSECLTGCKDTQKLRDRSNFYCKKQDITGQKPKQPFS